MSFFLNFVGVVCLFPGFFFRIKSLRSMISKRKLHIEEAKTNSNNKTNTKRELVWLLYYYGTPGSWNLAFSGRWTVYYAVSCF